MFEEPYRWVESIRNRREYLEEELSGGSPVIALPWERGIVIATAGAGTRKLYEIYDQIAFGGIGHPSDLEKFRTSVLEIAHIEGFNRSPADVNLQRLIKFGIAPVIKQAFEEVLHAPFIVRLLFVEISMITGKPFFMRLNYDGVFDESDREGILAPTSAMAEKMSGFLTAQNLSPAGSLGEASRWAMRTWAISKLPPPAEGTSPEEVASPAKLDALLKESFVQWNPEIAVIDRSEPGSSKVRNLSREEINLLFEDWVK